MDIIITDYQTASGKTVGELDKNVMKLIEQGYQPYGNPSYVMAGAEFLACQVMVQYEEIEEELEAGSEFE